MNTVAAVAARHVASQRVRERVFRGATLGAALLVLALVYGTLVTSLIALLLAIPISLGIAIFLTELAPPWMKRPVGVAIELLAAVPSIIFGIWGLFVLAPLLQEHVEP